MITMTLVFIMLLLTVQEIDQDKNNQTTRRKKKEKRESVTIFALKEDYSCNNVWLCIAIKLCM